MSLLSVEPFAVTIGMAASGSAWMPPRRWEPPVMGPMRGSPGASNTQLARATQTAVGRLGHQRRSATSPPFVTVTLIGDVCWDSSSVPPADVQGLPPRTRPCQGCDTRGRPSPGRYAGRIRCGGALDLVPSVTGVGAVDRARRELRWQPMENLRLAVSGCCRKVARTIATR